MLNATYNKNVTVLYLPLIRALFDACCICIFLIHTVEMVLQYYMCKEFLF